MQETNRHIVTEDSLEINNYEHEDQIRTILYKAHQQLDNIEKNAKIIRNIMQHKVKITATDKDSTQQEISYTDIRIYANNIAGMMQCHKSVLEYIPFCQ